MEVWLRDPIETDPMWRAKLDCQEKGPGLAEVPGCRRRRPGKGGHSSATPLLPALQSALCKDGCLEKQMLLLLTGLGGWLQP